MVRCCNIDPIDKERNLMYIPKTIALGAFLTCAAYLYGIKSTENTQPDASTANIAAIDLSHVSPDSCTSVKYTFKIWHDNQFDVNKYAAIKARFDELIGACKQSDADQASFAPIVEILGLPFSQIFNATKNKEGINGNLLINTETEQEGSIALELSITHEETYNIDAWQAAVSVGLEFFKDNQWIQSLSSLFTDVINAGNESGIHGSLDINAE